MTHINDNNDTHINAIVNAASNTSKRPLLETADTGYAPRASPEYSCGRRNPLYPILAVSFASIVLYLMHILLEKRMINFLILIKHYILFLSILANH